MIVRQLLLLSLQTVGESDLPFRQINRFHVCLDEVDVFEHLAERADDVRHLQVASRHLVQHWGEQDEVLTTNESHLNVRFCGNSLVQMQRRVEAAKAASDNQHARLLLRCESVGAHRCSSGVALTDFFPRPARHRRALCKRRPKP
jgi:hypothetical protein